MQKAGTWPMYSLIVITRTTPISLTLFDTLYGLWGSASIPEPEVVTKVLWVALQGVNSVPDYDILDSKTAAVLERVGSSAETAAASIAGYPVGNIALISKHEMLLMTVKRFSTHLRDVLHPLSREWMFKLRFYLTNTLHGGSRLVENLLVRTSTISFVLWRGLPRTAPLIKPKWRRKSFEHRLLRPIGPIFGTSLPTKAHLMQMWASSRQFHGEECGAVLSAGFWSRFCRKASIPVQYIWSLRDIDVNNTW